MCCNGREKGYFWKNCTKLKNKHNHKFGGYNDSIYSAEDTENALILIVDSSIESWILDLGASFHSLSKELFQNLKREIFCKVYLADNKNLDDWNEWEMFAYKLQ